MFRRYAVLCALLSGVVLGMAVASLWTPPARAAGAELPPDIFSPGNIVRGRDAVYLIQEVQGEWVKAVPYRSLDGFSAPPAQPRWICVPAFDAPWAKETAETR